MNEDRLFLNAFIQIGAMTAMTFQAKEMGLNKGVAFFMVKEIHADMGEIRFGVVNKTMVRRPVDGAVGDVGTNYFGVAMEKLAAMMDTGENSGTAVSLLKGESRYRGGLIKVIDGYQIYVGFSGGTEDQDVEIATLGMAMLFPEII